MTATMELSEILHTPVMLLKLVMTLLMFLIPPVLIINMGITLMTNPDIVSKLFFAEEENHTKAPD